MILTYSNGVLQVTFTVVEQALITAYQAVPRSDSFDSRVNEWLASMARVVTERKRETVADMVSGATLASLEKAEVVLR